MSHGAGSQDAAPGRVEGEAAPVIQPATVDEGADSPASMTPVEDPAMKAELEKEAAAAALGELLGTAPPVEVPKVVSNAPAPMPPPPTTWEMVAAAICFVLAAVGLWGLVTLVSAVWPIRSMRQYEWLGAFVLGVPIITFITLMVRWGVKTLTWRRQKWRASRRVRRRLCAQCNYDLRAATGFCPECGWAIPESYESMALKLEEIGPPMFVPAPVYGYGPYGQLMGAGVMPARVVPPVPDIELEDSEDASAGGGGDIELEDGK